MKRILGAVKIVCGRTGSERDVDDEEDDDQLLYDASYETADRPFYWSQALQQSFRAELEKYVSCLLRVGTMHRLTYRSQARHIRYAMSGLDERSC